MLRRSESKEPDQSQEKALDPDGSMESPAGDYGREMICLFSEIASAN